MAAPALKIDAAEPMDTAPCSFCGTIGAIGISRPDSVMCVACLGEELAQADAAEDGRDEMAERELYRGRAPR